MPTNKAQALASASTLPAILKTYYEVGPSLPDGIYIGLDNERYHADTALGSSNLRDLLKGANLFWSKSRMNPKRKKNQLTPSKIVGNATHKLLLEGRQAYEDIYVRGPYSSDNDDHLSQSEKTALTKGAKGKLMEGQFLLPRDDYDFVVGCKAVVDADPELEGCLDNAITELSVFWTRADGIRCKVRLDAHKQRGIGDIKTIANERERDMEVACRLDISTYRYDIPAEHYTEGRCQMPALLNAGKVFVEVTGANISYDRISADDGDREKWILDFLNNAEYRSGKFAFQMVFIPKQGAEDAWSCVLTRGNDLLTEARTDIETAITRFKEALEKFGLSQRWVPGRPVGELYREDLPISHGRVGQRVR